MSDCIIIGIAGGTASGKTTVAQKIKEVFGSNVELVSHDYYYLPHNDMTYEERTKINYDHPNAFETDRLIRDIRDLKAGKAVDVPVYDFTIHNRVDDTVRVEPKRVIIVEGILIFTCKELVDQMNIKIFVDADDDDRLMRIIVRDNLERGRDVTAVVNHYTETVKPMHLQFIEPSKRYADIIIPQGGHNKVAIKIIANTIEKALQEGE